MNDLDDMIDVIAELCLEGERKISTRRWLDSIKPNVPNGLPYITIPITNYRGLLPKGYYDATDIEAFCSNFVCQCGVTPCTCQNACACGLNAFTAWDFGCSCGYWYGYRTYEIDDFRIEGCYLVAPFRTGTARMKAYMMPLDEEGLPLILEVHRDALATYCAYEIAQGLSVVRKIDKQSVHDLFVRWLDLCAQARGKDRLPSRNQMGQAAATNNNPWKVSPGWGGGYGNGYGGNGWWW